MIAKNTERGAKGETLALSLLLAALMAACLLMVAAKPAHATTFAVDRTDDPDPTSAHDCTDSPNDCSLRGAIVAANSAAGADAITVPAGTYTLTRDGANEDAASTGDLDITEELTITGAGARTTSVAGGAAPFDDRIFENHSGVEATITGLTITGGKVAVVNGGGVNNQGDLTLDRVAVKDNTADFAGGIHSYGGTLDLTDSTVSGNSVTFDGGGVAHGGSGTANITNTTISDNRAGRFGGGVVAHTGTTMNIQNSTIASNTSGQPGGGIFIFTPGTLVLVKNTIVAGNTLDNCDTTQFGGAIFSQGHNISGDDSCDFTKTGDKQNTDPRLGPLTNNGGPTDTHALLAGSPAIDAGTNTDCPDADQRGVDRPQGSRCDIGAFEKEASPNGPPAATNDAYSVKEDKTLSVEPKGVLANDRDPDGDALAARVASKPKNGTLKLNANGSLTYKPKRNFNGKDSFAYEASDGRSGTDRATVSINVKSAPR